MNTHKETSGTMKRLSIVFIALVALLGSMLPVHAAESETFSGTAARSGTYHRPLLLVDGTRYELKASDKANASVAETLAMFSNGDTGTYVLKGTRGTVNGADGILVDSIAQAAQPLPSTGIAASATKAVQGNAPTASAQPTVRAALGATSAYSYDTYDYSETAARGVIKRYRLAIPAEVTTVKCILVVANCAGGDSRDWYKGGTAYEEFLHLHDFAFVGGAIDCSHFEAYDAFVKALATWAKESGHPELVNVPYVSTGVSAGGGFASTLVTKCPEKVIAAVPECARLNLTVFELKKYDPKNPVPVPDAVLRVPVLDNPGYGGGGPYTYVNLEAYRPVGALYSAAVSWAYADAYMGQEVMAMPYLETALKLRYPSTGDVRKAPLKLKPLDPLEGWVADNTAWQSSLTPICPTKQFKGDVRKTSWLMNKDIAYIFRAYAAYNPPLKITNPQQIPMMFGNPIGTPIQAPGSSITVKVDASKFPGWKTLEFYDGAKLLGTVTSGPTQFKATNLTPGFHTFSVLGTDSSGKVVTSNCGMVAVRK